MCKKYQLLYDQLIILLSFGLFILGLPIFRCGVWSDSEFGIICFQALTILMALSVLIKKQLFLSKNGILFGLMALLGIVLLPFHSHASLSFYGSPQLGEGIFYYLSILILCNALYNLPIENIKSIVIPLSIITSISAGLLILLNHYYYLGWYQDWIPYGFTAFLAFMAIPFLIGAFLYKSLLTRCVILFIAISLVIISCNKTGMLSLIIISILYFIPPHIYISYRKYIMCVIIFLPIAIVLLEFYLCNYFSSLHSRVNLTKILIKAFQDHPWKLLSGFGFGQYTNLWASYITKLSINFYQDGIWTPNWDSINRLDFHIHNQFLEAVLSVGIVGGLIFLAIPWLAIKNARDEYLKPITLTLMFYISISSTWFMVISNLPYLILALVIIEKINDVPLQLNLLKNWTYRSIILLVIISLSYGVKKQISCTFSYDGPTESIFHRLKISEDGLYCETTGMHLANYLAVELSYGQNCDKLVVRALLDKAIKIKNPPTILLINIIKAMDVASTTNNLREKYIDLLLLQAPYRTDLLVNYLLNLGPVVSQKKIARYLGQYPNDPILLWLKGLNLLMLGSKEESRLLMQKALSLGVEKFIPIDPLFISKIQNH